MEEFIEYFAFGSNLHIGQMKDRGIEIIETEIAQLPGWKLAFTIYSKNWGGGVGDIVPCSNDKVEGVIYTIHKKGLEKLDHYEGRDIKNEMDIGMYRRQHIPVKTKKGWKTVLTYTVNRTPEYKKRSCIKPSSEYLDTIIKGAVEHNLSEDYIERLKNIKCR